MTQSPDRFRFFDRVRAAVILLVVAFHVSAAHTGFPVYIMEANSHMGFAFFNLICNAFMMNTLFLVAGFFSIASLEHSTRTGFVVSKLRRLGIPWVVGVVFLGPPMPYMGYASQSFDGLSATGFLPFLQVYFGSLFSSWTLPVAFTANPVFHQHHFWFLSVLLFIFCLQALSRSLWQGWLGRTADPRLSLRPTVPVLLGVVALVTLVSGLGHALVPDEAGQRVVAGVLQVSVVGFLTHVIYFVLGAIACRAHWFIDADRTPRSLLLWIILAAVAITCACITVWWVFGVEDAPFLDVFAFGGAMALTCMSLVILTHMLVFRFWATAGRGSDAVSRNSFGIYLVQYPVVLAVQLLLLSWNPFHGIKWAFVTLLSVGISWCLAEFCIRRMPRLGVLLTT